MTSAHNPHLEVTAEDRELFILLLGLDATRDVSHIRHGVFDEWTNMQAIARHRQLPADAPANSEREDRTIRINRADMSKPADHWPDWLQGRVAVLSYAEQGFRVCAQPGGNDIGNGEWGHYIVEYPDGTLGVRATLSNPAGDCHPPS